jgi:hypothetical protein
MGFRNTNFHHDRGSRPGAFLTCQHPGSPWWPQHPFNLVTERNRLRAVSQSFVPTGASYSRQFVKNCAA